MQLTLIGMSGVGKSHWSKKMESLGYVRYCCDELIAERLGTVLGEKGKATANLAKWMGEPYSDGYQETEALYLELESAVISQICDELEYGIQKDKLVVVDTTGSLVYLEKELIERLRKLTQTVFLNIPDDKHEELFESYLKDPKPVIWNGQYIPYKGEIPKIALRRCYSELLSFRNRNYALISDSQLDYSFHQNAGTTLKDFIELVGSSLKHYS